MNYFLLNNIHSFRNLKIKGNTPIIPSFLENLDTYTITFEYFYIKNNKNDMDIFEHHSFLEETISNELNKDEVRLILSQDINNYYLVKSASVNITEVSKNAIRYNIVFDVYRYKRILSQSQFELIELTQTDIENEFIFNLDSKGIFAKSVFKITTNDVGNDTITLNINNEIFILTNVKINSTIYLDFDLKECYSETELLNSNLEGRLSLFKLKKGINNCKLITSNNNIESLEVKINSFTY